MIIFLFVLEALAIQDIVAAALILLGGFVTLKTGLLQGLFSSSKQALEQTKQERDNLAKEVKELKDENRILRREVTQRIEINQQDQEMIRELKRKELKNG